MPRPSRELLCAAALLVLSACASKGLYVWVDDYAHAIARSEAGYVISRGDVLNVRVWNQEGMTTRARVRTDGRISLPFLGEVVAAGYKPDVLAQQLQTRLKDYFVSPVVTIALEEQQPTQVSVVGEVARPGNYMLAPGVGLLGLLTEAGGLTEFADRDGVYVLRRDGEKVERIRFKWLALTRAEGKAAEFALQRGDAVVVE